MSTDEGLVSYRLQGDQWHAEASCPAEECHAKFSCADPDKFEAGADVVRKLGMHRVAAQH